MKAEKLCVFVDRLNGGGAEKVLITLANELAETCNVDLVVACHGGVLEKLVSPSVNLIHLRSKRTIRALWGFTKYLKKTRPDAILSGKVNSNAIAIMSRKLGSPASRLVISEHSLVNTSKRSGIKGLVEGTIMTVLYPYADRIVTVSPSSRSELAQKMSLSESALEVIPNPILSRDFIEVMKSAPTLDISPDTRLVLAMGRLESVKGFDDLIRGFAAIRPRPAAKLIILGEGSEREYLEKLIEDLDVSDLISLPGFCDDPLPYLKRADVFCLSSHAESLGNVLIEAAAADTIIVSRNCPGGPRDILAHAENAILLDDFSPDIVAKAICRALDANDDIRTKIDHEPYLVDGVVNRYRNLLVGP